MPCPACNQPMLILELDAIELDHCPACGGIWLDTGELETIVERAGARSGRLAELLAKAPENPAGKRRCPRCRRRMRLVDVAAGGASVRIDRCPQGHGLWLDKGELRQLVDLGAEAAGAAAGERQAVARFFADALRGIF